MWPEELSNSYSSLDSENIPNFTKGCFPSNEYLPLRFYFIRPKVFDSRDFMSKVSPSFSIFGNWLMMIIYRNHGYMRNLCIFFPLIFTINSFKINLEKLKSRHAARTTIAPVFCREISSAPHFLPEMQLTVRGQHFVSFEVAKS
ncbi:unnamed protein product [Lactuca saligna]|uniref:Uncharacterized protein n=1 Tax=Lactuca saligna TaxID=75948 RepID=A0AA36E4G2_LACSI|nr:unnamed protein product [Lactuca saligna]